MCASRNLPIQDPASYRDPKGTVYHHSSRVFRTVTSCGVEDFQFVLSTGLLERLESEGKIIATRVAKEEEIPPECLQVPGVEFVIEHPKIELITYPYEWSFGALKRAALLQLDIHLAALECGVTLSDASAYNIQFIGKDPVFIDLLSFCRYREGEPWLGHRQYCEQFLNPLLLRAYKNIAHNSWYRGTLEGIPSAELLKILDLSTKFRFNSFIHLLLPNLFQNFRTKVDARAISQKQRRIPLHTIVFLLRSLRKWVEKLRIPSCRGSVWSEYSEANTYSNEEREAKKEYVADFVCQHQPRTLWDLGCNTGDFSVVALNNGVETAVGWEYDPLTLELAYKRAVDEGLNFLPLFLDAVNPSPCQGWRQSERRGFAERANADAVIALAFIHHLAIARNIPLEEAIDFVVSLAPVGVVEFVPKSDPTVQVMLENRQDIFPHYTEDNFLHLLGNKVRITNTKLVSKTSRKLVTFEK